MKIPGLSMILRKPTKPIHWLILGLLFSALWIPRLSLFSAGAFDVCADVPNSLIQRSHSAAHANSSAPDSQIKTDMCGVSFAIMTSQFGLATQTVPQILGSAPRSMSRMAISSAHPVTLHSRPSATRKLYLDFDGYTFPEVSAWFGAGVWTINAGTQFRGISLDEDQTTFSVEENTYIQQIWAGVAEDFSAFDLDVTTEDPGTDGLSRSDFSDLNFGTTAVISDEFTRSLQCRCGGIAYVGIVDFESADSTPNPYAPSFVFRKQQSDADFLSAQDSSGVISHEVGHNLGLGHDGTVGNALSDAYYPGHSNGLWAPIMGSSYGNAMTQWSKNEYQDGKVTSEPDYSDAWDYDPDLDSWSYLGCTSDACKDDFNVIQENQIPLAADDYQDSADTAYNLSGLSFSKDGYIGPNSDVDLFKFVLTGSTKVTLDASVSSISPNLDIKMTLYNASGATLLENDETVSQDAENNPTNLSAQISSYSLSAGTFYVSIEGTGALDPLTDGYSQYASVGKYTLSGSIGEAPSYTTGLSISGTQKVGQTLTANKGTWTGYPTPTYTYKWQFLDGGTWTNLADYSAVATYKLTSSETNKKVRVIVKATNTLDSDESTSAETSAIAGPPWVRTPNLTLSGTARVGETLSYTDGTTWQANPTVTPTYQWYRCKAAKLATTSSKTTALSGCTAISGATLDTYTLRNSSGNVDIAKYITVAATGKNTNGTLMLWAASTANAISQAPSNTVRPSISGKVKVGTTLTAKFGTWLGFPVPTYTYQWQYLNGPSYADIDGATMAKYKVTSDVIGKKIRVKVAGTNTVDSQPANSAATTEAVGPPSVSSPGLTIAGTPDVGGTITATDISTWIAFPSVTPTYQWYQCKSVIPLATKSTKASALSGCKAISAQTSSTYQLQAGDKDKYVTVARSAKNSAGTLVLWSASTSVVLLTPP